MNPLSTTIFQYNLGSYLQYEKMLLVLLSLYFCSEAPLLKAHYSMMSSLLRLSMQWWTPATCMGRWSPVSVRLLVYLVLHFSTTAHTWTRGRTSYISTSSEKFIHTTVDLEYTEKQLDIWDKEIVCF